MDTTIGFIRAAIGSANIRRYTMDSEAGPLPVYTLRICTHNIEWYDYGASWSDSAHRTQEGLGVGSTLSAFDSAIGLGRISGDHGLQVRYELDRYNLYVDVGDCYTIGPNSTVDRSFASMEWPWRRAIGQRSESHPRLFTVSNVKTVAPLHHYAWTGAWRLATGDCPTSDSSSPLSPAPLHARPIGSAR